MIDGTENLTPDEIVRRLNEQRTIRVLAYKRMVESFLGPENGHIAPSDLDALSDKLGADELNGDIP